MYRDALDLLSIVGDAVSRSVAVHFLGLSSPRLVGLGGQHNERLG